MKYIYPDLLEALPVHYRVVLYSMLLLLVACGPSDQDVAARPTQPVELGQAESQSTPAPATEGEGYPAPGTEAGYPGPDGTGNESGYPGPSGFLPEGLLTEAPNPERNLPRADAGRATVGGVLVQEYVDQGFVPLMPVELTLGTVVGTAEGDAAFLRTSSNALKAQLFPTGIFVFSNVEPGTYGLIVDVGYTNFAVREADGDELLMFTVEAGEVRDLGQIITPLPDS